MAPAANSILAFIVVALGLIGIILSFLVPDRKKSLIAMALGGFIVVVGLFQWVSHAYSQHSWNRRMRNLQRERQVNLDELREQMKQRTTPPAAPASKK